MLDKINRSMALIGLTRKYFRARQVPTPCLYYINGVSRTVRGEQALSMLIDIVVDDSYGLKRYKHIDSIVDVGANIGIFALHASTLFPKAKVLAYEPCTQSRLVMQENVAGLNVKVCPFAVGSARGKVNMNYQEDLTACYVSLDNATSASENQECEMVSLDDIAADVSPQISLLKLDCEGSEYEIMQTSSFKDFRYVVGELHTCQHGDPIFGLATLKEKGFIIDKWFPFSDGKAGVFWAINSSYK